MVDMVPLPLASRRSLLSTVAGAAAVAVGGAVGLSGRALAQQTRTAVANAVAKVAVDGSGGNADGSVAADAVPQTAGRAERNVRVLRLGYIADEGSAVTDGVALLAERLDGQHGMVLQPSAFDGRGWGDTQLVLHALQSGSLDVGLIETEQLSRLYAGMAVWGMPYLFDSTAQAHRVLDGDVGQSVLNGLLSQGLKGLAYWESGFLVAGSSVRSVVRPEDAAGLRVAVPAGCVTLRSMCDALRARAVMMRPQMDYVAALQRRAVDTQMSPVDWMVRQKLHLRQRFVSAMHQQYAALALVVRLPVWLALDDEQRTQLQLLAAFARDYQRQRAHRSKAMALLELSQTGCTVSTFDRMQVQRFAKRFEKVSAEVVRRCGSRLWLELFEAREKASGVG